MKIELIRSSPKSKKSIMQSNWYFLLVNDKWHVEIPTMDIKFAPQDFWIGLYIDYDKVEVWIGKLDLYFCVIPMFPIIISFAWSKISNRKSYDAPIEDYIQTRLFKIGRMKDDNSTT